MAERIEFEFFTHPYPGGIQHLCLYNRDGSNGMARICDAEWFDKIQEFPTGLDCSNILRVVSERICPRCLKILVLRSYGKDVVPVGKHGKVKLREALVEPTPQNQ